MTTVDTATSGSLRVDVVDADMEIYCVIEGKVIDGYGFRIKTPSDMDDPIQASLLSYRGLRKILDESMYEFVHMDTKVTCTYCKQDGASRYEHDNFLFPISLHKSCFPDFIEDLSECADQVQKYYVSSSV